tara:strand:+ start:484 stop:615 length:132 start_codon:yes stop_codon:yes gene_type:complete
MRSPKSPDLLRFRALDVIAGANVVDRSSSSVIADGGRTAVFLL